MFGESKAVETGTLPPAAKVESTLNLKNATGEISTPPAAKIPETKHAANFARLKKSLRKGSRGIF